MNDDAYYYGLRTIARARTMEALNSRILKDGRIQDWDGTELASISDEAIEFAETVWPEHYAEHTHFGFMKPWSSIWYHSQLHAARFDLAIWQSRPGGKILQGLAVGSTSKGREHLSLNWVERNFGPDYNHFGILIPTLMCFEEYARLIGCKRVLIKNPVDPNVYCRYGYAPSKVQGSKTYFLCKEMPNG